MWAAGNRTRSVIKRILAIALPVAAHQTRRIPHPGACLKDQQQRFLDEDIYVDIQLLDAAQTQSVLLPRRFSGNQFERYIPEAISVIGIESVCGYTAAEIGRSLGHHVRFSTVFEITAADPIQ